MKELLKKIEVFYYTRVLEPIRKVGIVNAFYTLFVAILSFLLWRN